MLTFTVTAHESLLGVFAGALLRELRPGTEIRVEDKRGAWPGITIADSTSGRWLFLSSNNEPDSSAAEAIAAGACAVLTIDAAPADFMKSIEVLLTEGESYIPPRIARWIAEEAMGHRNESDATPSPGSELTLRERDVLRLVALGYSNAEIAHALTISSNTVRSHLHALCVKLKANGRMKMLANARAQHIPEAFALDEPGVDRATA